MYKKVYLLAGLCILLFTTCTKQSYYQDSGSTFHTLYKIKYQAPALLTEKIDAELQAFNLSLNPFNPNSIIAKVNRNEPVEVDELFTEVFLKSKEIYEASDGIFDPTAAPLFNAWGFGFSKMDSVTPQMIDSIKNFVGFNKIRLDGKTVVKDDPRILLNFSAIAKGYASDVIARLMEREGVTNYLIDIGGEMTMQGVNQYGNCWQVGINEAKDDPEGINQNYQEIVRPCRKCGLATSGDYRNFYIKDGRKYAHTIDPRTGYPAGQSMLSASILADNCITADGYATAFMAMGVDKAIDMARNIPEIEYYIIYADEQGEHQILYSEGMKQYLLKRGIPNGETPS